MEKAHEGRKGGRRSNLRSEVGSVFRKDELSVLLEFEYTNRLESQRRSRSACYGVLHVEGSVLKKVLIVVCIILRGSRNAQLSRSDDHR